MPMLEKEHNSLKLYPIFDNGLKNDLFLRPNEYVKYQDDNFIIKSFEITL